MDNVSRGPTFGDFVTILREGCMQDITIARLHSTRVQSPLSPSIKCNVLRKSLSEDSQNISCATLSKRRGSRVISVQNLKITKWAVPSTIMSIFYERENSRVVCEKVWSEREVYFFHWKGAKAFVGTRSVR